VVSKKRAREEESFDECECCLEWLHVLEEKHEQRVHSRMDGWIDWRVSVLVFVFVFDFVCFRSNE
jgi:hypothetical protein